MTTHCTTVESNPFPSAGMLRQVALIRDYGHTIANPAAVYLLRCDQCDWHETAADHAEQIDKRLLHEAETRSPQERAQRSADALRACTGAVSVVVTDGDVVATSAR